MIIAIRNQIALILTGFGACCLPIGYVSAINPQTDCSKDLILAFFPEAFVKNTLNKFNVPQDQWEPIMKDLSNKDKEVIKIVEDRAAKMDPNPLKDPTKQADAVKIFRETLLQIFGDSLKAHGVTDDAKIQEMLDDIQSQKAKRFSDCFPSQKS